MYQDVPWQGLLYLIELFYFICQRHGPPYYPSGIMLSNQLMQLFFSWSVMHIVLYSALVYELWGLNRIINVVYRQYLQSTDKLLTSCF